VSPYRLLLFPLSALAALVLSGAEASPLRAAFGSTIVSVYPDGRTAELWLQPGGAYTAKGRRGDGSSGHWKVSDGKLCLSQSSPFPAPFSFCTPIPAGHLNTPWSAKAVTGEAIRVRLVKGRYEGVTRPASNDSAERSASASRQN
jgi:hypothetical protein